MIRAFGERGDARRIAEEIDHPAGDEAADPEERLEYPAQKQRHHDADEDEGIAGPVQGHEQAANGGENIHGPVHQGIREPALSASPSPSPACRGEEPRSRLDSPDALFRLAGATWGEASKAVNRAAARRDGPERASAGPGFRSGTDGASHETCFQPSDSLKLTTTIGVISCAAQHETIRDRHGIRASATAAAWLPEGTGRPAPHSDGGASGGSFPVATVSVSSLARLRSASPMQTWTSAKTGGSPWIRSMH